MRIFFVVIILVEIDGVDRTGHQRVAYGSCQDSMDVRQGQQRAGMGAGPRPGEDRRIEIIRAVQILVQIAFCFLMRIWVPLACGRVFFLCIFYEPSLAKHHVNNKEERRKTEKSKGRRADRKQNVFVN